jgi:PmbA protein
MRRVNGTGGGHITGGRGAVSGQPAPLEIARRALDRGSRLGADLEVYFQAGRTASIKVYGGQVESISVAEPCGLGVRAMKRGQVGYAFTADLSDSGMDAVLAGAVANVQATDPDQYASLPARSAVPYPSIPGLWRPGVGRLSLEDKVALALAVERRALACPRVETVEESVYSDEESRVAICSSTGVEAEAEHSFCFVYAQAHAGHDSERQSGLGFSAGRDPEELDPEAAGAEAGEKAAALLGARPCDTGSYTVVFAREVMAALLAYVAQGLSADAVQKGRSLFAGKLGQGIGAGLVTLVDDGLAPGGMATNPFDGEGVPRQRTTLLRAGVLEAYLHSSYTARKAGEGAASTGNAERGSYRSGPRVAASNLVLAEGSGTLDELVARVGSGLYVENAAGLHSGVNVISGEISVGVTGRMIQNGALAHPVREVTIATDFLSLLGSVSDLGADTRWIPLYGSVCTPSVAVERITVSGR